MKQYNVISFGAGMQSTAMFRMACLGLIEPKPDFAVFADTGWERDGTYENLKACQDFGEAHGIPIHVVSRGDIRMSMEEQNFANLPFFMNTQRIIERDDGAEIIYPKKATPTMLRRQCTNQYKLLPMRRFLREKTGCNFKNPLIQWIGISIDEALRQKQPREKYLEARYPLIQMRMSRKDCEKWLKDNEFVVPVRSSCVGCPYHSEVEWNDLTPDEFEQACLFDEKMRDIGMTHKDKNKRYIDDKVYLHRSLRPLRERPFDKSNPLQLDLFETKDTTCDEGGCFL